MANEIGYWNASPSNTSNPSSGNFSHTSAAGYTYTASSGDQITYVRALVGENTGTGDGPEYFIACRRLSDDEIMFSQSIGVTESAGVLEELGAAVSWSLVDGVEYALILSILAADVIDMFVGYETSASVIERSFENDNNHTVGQTWTTDQSDLAWDVVFAADVTAAAAGATLTDVNLVDLTGTAQASLTSLRWSWFDVVAPASFSTPINQGTAESTDGSGNITLDLTNSTLTTGQEGCLVLSNAGGTIIGAYRLAVD